MNLPDLDIGFVVMTFVVVVSLVVVVVVVVASGGVFALAVAVTSDLVSSFDVFISCVVVCTYPSTDARNSSASANVNVVVASCIAMSSRIVVTSCADTPCSKRVLDISSGIGELVVDSSVVDISGESPLSSCVVNGIASVVGVIVVRNSSVVVGPRSVEPCGVSCFTVV